MPMHAGRLRHRVTIQWSDPTTDANGQEIPNWSPLPTLPTVWAEVRTLSSRETFNSQQTQSTATHKITIRYRGDMKSEYRFAYADPGTGTTRYFSIDGTPTDPENRREFLECLCEERGA